MTKESKVSIIVALIGVLGGSGAGYYSGLASVSERVRAVEVRQEEQYKAVLARIDDVGVRTRQGHEDIKMDLQGIRSEIMNILRDLRR